MDLPDSIYILIRFPNAVNERVATGIQSFKHQNTVFFTLEKDEKKTTPDFLCSGVDIFTGTA